MDRFKRVESTPKSYFLVPDLTEIRKEYKYDHILVKGKFKVETKGYIFQAPLSPIAVQTADILAFALNYEKWAGSTHLTEKDRLSIQNAVCNVRRDRR